MILQTHQVFLLLIIFAVILRLGPSAAKPLLDTGFVIFNVKSKVFQILFYSLISSKFFQKHSSYYINHVLFKVMFYHLKIVTLFTNFFAIATIVIQ